MKTLKEYYINLGLVWLFVPLITGFSFHLHPFFGLVVWVGIAVILISAGLVVPKGNKETSETQNNDKTNSST